MELNTFRPHYGTNQVLAPAAASAVANLDKTDECVQVVNTGAAIGYFRTYSSLTVPAPAATVADCPVNAGATVYVRKGQEHDRMAFISATGTTFQVMTGEGGI